MAEVPTGPSALPASPAEIISFPGAVCALPAGTEERGCGRGELHSSGTAAEGIARNHVCCHPSAATFSPQSQQQLNGLVNSAEDGPLSSPHRGCGLSHLHHPAHRATEGRKVPPGGGCLAPSEDGPCSNHIHANEECGEEATSNLNRTEGRQPGSDADEVLEPAVGPGAQRPRVEAAAAGIAVETVVETAMERLQLNSAAESGDHIRYVRYESELQMPDIMRLITKDLSEPYSIYTYRYFIHNWPQLCFLAMVQQECVGAIVCKLDVHKKMFRRGYIAMLAVDSRFRRKGIGTNLVKKAIYAMVDGDCDEVVLETEITNKSALKLYENLGFVRDKRLFRYYLNGVDALRLKLWLR
ncbi:N-alpha-acetyltransferase 30 [Arapaima gigas]